MHVARLAAVGLLVVLLSGVEARAADFGSPPSGQIPIFYNDQHVYAKPDVLRTGRVLAALVKNGEILVPLRSMFESMGATVSYNATAKSFSVQRSDASVILTLNKKSAVINGETRPLDQAPIMYQGVALVPIRVISETMGAYVQWVQERRLAVVRYIPPTPVPTAPPTPAPTAPPPPPPPPPPTPAPTKAPYQYLLQGGFASGTNFNEFVDGAHCFRNSYVWAAAWVPHNSPIALKVDFRQDAYVTSDNVIGAGGNHFTIFNTIDGGVQATPVFLGKQTTLDGRVEYRLLNPNIFVGISYLTTSTTYGYPHDNGFGFGAEKLPDFTSTVSYFASLFYFPSATGNYTIPNPASTNFGKTYQQQYSIAKYDIGLALSEKKLPVYLYGGWSGNAYWARNNAPGGQTHSGPYIGLGVRF